MLAEDLAMLLHDPETGRLLVSSDRANLVLGGALLADLADLDRIELSEPHRATKNRTVAVVDPTPTGDPVLDEALQRIISGRARRSHVVVSKISSVARDRLKGSSPGRVGEAEELKRELRQVLDGERSPTLREAAIVSLLQGAGRTAKVVGDAGLGGRELKRRAKAIAEGNAAGEAVRQALNAAAF